MECADEVLARGMVDGRFAADGGVDVGFECGRTLHERYAAEPCCRGQTGYVTHNATSERDDRLVAAVMMCGELIEHGGELRERF